MKKYIGVHVVAINGSECDEARMVIDNDIVYIVSDEHNHDNGKATIMLCYPGVTKSVLIEVTETIEDVMRKVNNCIKEA